MNSEPIDHQSPSPANRTDLISLLSLLAVPEIGNKRAFELINLFGSSSEVLKSPAGEIASAIKIPLEVGQNVVQAGHNTEEAHKIIERMDEIGGQIVTVWDEAYPARLKKITDPPVVLYIMGEWSPLYYYSVAMVGTRSASNHGRRITPLIARELAEQGVTVVSGMAEGIDSLAHIGALEAGGRTIAVLGSGLDVIYPPSNRKLYARIIRQGAVMSEYPPGTKPETHHFPQRNRIISGISLGVVVVEAPSKSGALITAELADKQSRAIFAVPGDGGLTRSAGTNELIKSKNAIMVESGKEIIEELRSQLAPVLNVAATMVLPDMNDDEKLIYDLLENGALLKNDIIRETGLTVAKFGMILTSMQTRKLVKNYPGAQIGRA
ncbi:MAG: DNA-processing protein DprA [Candidatus Electryoneaceae bacterium]|nr:DNA-processing protein DprA [Candidatus Electryoneaceae bacterium]